MTDTVLSRLASRGLVWLLAIAAAFAASTLYSRAEPLSPVDVRGVVAGTDFTPPSGGRASITVASRYQHAVVCADANSNGACDAGEPTTTTDDTGGFLLKNAGRSPLVAEVAAVSVTAGHPVGRRLVLRAAADQLSDTPVVVSPLTTEVVRMMEAGASTYQTARQQLAARLDVAPDDVVKDPAEVTDARVRQSLLRESVILTNRLALAATMVDRHEMTIKEAQQAVMNLEDIPRYDHLFIIMLENKATSAIKGSPFAPKINAYLNDGNQFTSYFSTGKPSEPNRVALAAGDDFGIVDDDPWNCMPAEDTADAPEDPLPPELKPCINASNHNIKNRPNMFSALSAAGMTWRVYSESMNPGRDWRLDSVGDNAITAPDTVYPANSPVGAIGTPGLKLRMPGRLYAAKHNASLYFQAVRSSADFVRNNRTMGGGQWDAALKAAPTAPAGWDMDQLGSDLASGDVGNLNFLEPDQCDDMHGVKAQGTTDADPTVQMASDCDGDAIVFRGDRYTDYLIRKIQASAVWKNTDKRTAIVIMFDEGKDTTGFNSCCGWNPSAGPAIAGHSLGVLIRNADGTISTTPLAQYNQGNKGHGPSIFGVLTNQPLAPKRVIDSDAYSHISFVRTMQDMFGLADPGDDWSYMNRTKYTEKFIAANLTNLPEFAGSADPHFDAVRPMNHAYVIPRDYVQKSGFVIPPGPQSGPDPNQVNPWALTRGRDLRSPLSPAAAVGRELFFDTSLSASGRMSCATCHDPKHAYAPANGLSVQLGGPALTDAGTRAVPSLRYSEYTPPYSDLLDNPDGISQPGPGGGLTEDGRAPTLADQAQIPLLAPNEMANGNAADVVHKIQMSPYARAFEDAFGRGVFSDTGAAFRHALEALQAFQIEDDSFHPYSSKYDLYASNKIGGQLTPAELRGFAVYNDPKKGNCFACHYNGAGINGAVRLFTDYTYAAIGVPRNKAIPANGDSRHYDLGICGRADHRLPAGANYCGMFKTPTLRNVAARQVFFHNGQLKSLRDVIRFYNTRDTNPELWYPEVNGIVQKFDDLPAPYRTNIDTQAPLDGRPRGATPAMSDQDIDDLLAFLGTLTDRDVLPASTSARD